MLSENKTKNSILMAGLKLVNAGGFGSLSISEVARAAKISKQSLYYHYSDMEELFFDLVKIWSQTGQSCTIEVLAKSSSSGRERVIAIVEGMFLWIQRYPDISKLGLAMFQSGPNLRHVKKYMDNAREVGRQRLKEILKTDPAFAEVKAASLENLVTGIHTIMYGSFLYICAMNDFENLNYHQQTCIENIKGLIRAQINSAH